MRWVYTLALAAAVASSNVNAQTPVPAITVDPDATVHFPPLAVPFSSFASPEAKQAYLDAVARPSPFGDGPHDVMRDIDRMRTGVNAASMPNLDHAKQLYPVKIETETIAGVTADIVTPAEGVPAGKRDKVLIELHGGGFLFGARITGQIESVPIAGLGKYKVIALDYREGPEDKFPAASEDVAAVYKELLKHYKPKNIGIYGCSAGGVLTGESMAWFQKEKLPIPGAIGIFCASGSGWSGGDSAYVTAPYGRTMPIVGTPHSQYSDGPYFSNADMNDPLVSPVVSPTVLAKFPPTLMMTGTRDVAMSAAVHTHAELVKAGVDADLHVWDGMGHAFFYDPTLPESKEAFAVVVKFFDRHLGR
jgi:acetyl esterase/lipase